MILTGIIWTLETESDRKRSLVAYIKNKTQIQLNVSDWQSNVKKSRNELDYTYSGPTEVCGWKISL